MDTDALISPAARCQTGDDSREDTVMDLRLREAEGNEVGTTESEKKKKKEETRAEEMELGRETEFGRKRGDRGERINFDEILISIVKTAKSSTCYLSTPH